MQVGHRAALLLSILFVGVVGFVAAEHQTNNGWIEKHELYVEETTLLLCSTAIK